MLKFRNYVCILSYKDWDELVRTGTPVYSEDGDELGIFLLNTRGYAITRPDRFPMIYKERVDCNNSKYWLTQIDSESAKKLYTELLNKLKYLQDELKNVESFKEVMTQNQF